MEHIPRIIVKTKYLKGASHKEYYVDYIATREGAEMVQSSNGDKPATPKQKKLIEELIKDFPDTKSMFEYEDYLSHPTRDHASELIKMVMDQNIIDVSTKENYVDYIANRPRVERLGEHGLFSDEDKSINLQQVAHEVSHHKGTVWTHIISLKREDAQRLGYDTALSWMDLCRAKRNDIADAMRIPPDDLRWYAAFHNEGHHPHIHMIAYSKDPRKGFVTPEGIARIRKMFASEIFHQDLIHMYQGQTEARDELKHYSKDVVEKALQGLQDKKLCDDKALLEKIKLLKSSLATYQGRPMYAYLPKDIKRKVDDIVKDIEQEPHVQALYEQWQLYRQDIHQTYHDELPTQLPLSQQKEFKSIKNMILKEVMAYDENRVDFDELDDDYIPENSIDRFDESPIVEEVQSITTSIQKSEYVLDWSQDYKKATALLYGSKDVGQDVKEAKALLEKECGRGNVLAYELLAKLYETFDKENIEAKDYYAKAYEGSLAILEEDGSAFVQSYLHYKVGKFYFYGKGTLQNYEEAFQHFKQSDSQYAQYSLGTMYHRGFHVEQSDQLAFAYYQKSANKGNPFACYEVGSFYDQGTVVQKDKEQADMFYMNAYLKFNHMLDQQEDDNLLYRLGEMTYNGKGCEADILKAKAYLEKAVSFDNKNAKYLLANIYLKEFDVTHIPQAIQWLEESQHPHASYLLGMEYWKGLCVERDVSKAIHYLKLSSELNHSFAMYQLAKIYLSDVQYYDPEQGIDHLKKSASLGNEFAQVALGKELLKGEIVDKNVEEPVPYLQEAAKKDNMFAQYILGKLFLFGKDDPQDKEKAIVYLERSAVQGNVHAQYLLEHMEDFHQQPIALLATRFFHHVSHIFTQTMPCEKSMLAGVDKKLAQKIKRKKIAQGHHPKDHDINIG